MGAETGLVCATNFMAWKRTAYRSGGMAARIAERSEYMKALHMLTLVLLIVGGLNWGLWGLFEFDLVAALFGGNTALLSKVVYTLVGVSALVQAFGLFAKTSDSNSHAMA
jgi:uncharacterized membrane protein YuzA (DUF378 family)